MTASNQYITQVRQALFCTRLHQEKCIHNLQPLVWDFASEQPDATLSDFRQEFGEPEELAQQYMSTLEDGEVQKYKQRRKWRHRACWVAVAAIIIAMAIGLLAKYTRVFEPPITAETTLVVTQGTTIEELKELLEEMGYAD